MDLLFSIKLSFFLFTAADILSRSYSSQSSYMPGPDFRDHQNIQEVPVQVVDQNNMVRPEHHGGG